MKIGFTYDLRSKHQPDENSPADFYGEFESEETITAIVEALEILGHQVTQIGNIKSLLHFLADDKRVDLVFNMAEGRHGRARESQVPANVCGQMSGSPQYTMLLLGLGLRELSVPPSAIPEIKKICRTVALPQCETLARRAMLMDSAREIDVYVREELRKLLPELFLN